MTQREKRPYEPSRLTVNLGVLIGGAIGIALTLLLELDEAAAFLITGLCALLGVALLGYTEVFLIRPRHNK